jgi:hypothetical protein
MHHVHSSVALDRHLADKSSTTWHHFHQTAKEHYASLVPELKIAFLSGEHQPLHTRLVYFALNFASATPINQGTSVGFYDTFDGGDKPKEVRTSCIVYRLLPSRLIDEMAKSSSSKRALGNTRSISGQLGPVTRSRTSTPGVSQAPTSRVSKRSRSPEVDDHPRKQMRRAETIGAWGTSQVCQLLARALASLSEYLGKGIPPSNSRSSDERGCTGGVELPTPGSGSNISTSKAIPEEGLVFSNKNYKS